MSKNLQGLLKIAFDGEDSFEKTARIKLNRNTLVNLGGLAVGLGSLGSIASNLQASASVKSKLKSLSDGGGHHLVTDNVRSFFNDIKLPMAEEFKGIPGEDYDATRWVKNPWEQFSFGYTSAPEVGGIYNQAFKHITINPKNVDKEGTLAHEISHGLQSPGMLNVGRPRGLSKNDVNKLDAAYKFNPSTVKAYYPSYYPTPVLESQAIQEAHSTNSEYQLRLFKELKSKLGRSPTYDEYKDFVSGLSDDEVRAQVMNRPNAYQYRALENKKTIDEKRLEAIRRAWLEVAKNRNTPMQRTPAPAFRKTAQAWPTTPMEQFYNPDMVIQQSEQKSQKATPKKENKDPNSWTRNVKPPLDPSLQYQTAVTGGRVPVQNNIPTQPNEYAKAIKEEGLPVANHIASRILKNLVSLPISALDVLDSVGRGIERPFIAWHPGARKWLDEDTAAAKKNFQWLQNKNTEFWDQTIKK